MTDQREHTILAALEQKAAHHNIDIVSVELVGSQKAPCVRVRIDHALDPEKDTAFKNAAVSTEQGSVASFEQDTTSAKDACLSAGATSSEELTAEQSQVITLDEVAAQTSWISDALDTLDIFPGSFTLEVSSPGLDRPLRRPIDFKRFAGNQISLETTATEGRKRYTAELLGFEDGAILLKEDGKSFSIAFDELKRAHIKPDFSRIVQNKKGN